MRVLFAAWVRRPYKLCMVLLYNYPLCWYVNHILCFAEKSDKFIIMYDLSSVCDRIDVAYWNNLPRKVGRNVRNFVKLIVGGGKMDILKQLNDAIVYVEAHLCEDSLDMNRLTHITGVTKDSFCAFFSYMTSMSLREYIRRRRLTLAAYELRSTDIKVIDAAFKYGYRSADAFAKAFKGQHGFAPTKARDLFRPLKVYPPASFHIIIKGAKEMEVRFIETEQISRVVCRGNSPAALRCDLNRSATCGLKTAAIWIKLVPKTMVSGTGFGIMDSTGLPKRKAGRSALKLSCIKFLPGHMPFYDRKGGFAGDELPILRVDFLMRGCPIPAMSRQGTMRLRSTICFEKEKKQTVL